MIDQTIDELLDIVNEQDEVISTQWRSLTHNGEYKRSILVFLINDEGKLCLFRRAAHKKSWASLFALVGGCVSSGEHYDQAFAREVSEEVNLNVAHYSHRFLGLLKPQETESCYFKAMYEIKVNHSEIDFNIDDFTEHVWIKPQELFGERFVDEKVAPDLRYLVERFYGHTFNK